MCYIDNLYNLLRHIHLIYFIFEASSLAIGYNLSYKGYKICKKTNTTHLLPFHSLPQLNNTFVKLKILRVLKRIYRTKRLDGIMVFFFEVWWMLRFEVLIINQSQSNSLKLLEYSKFLKEDFFLKFLMIQERNCHLDKQKGYRKIKT